MSEMPFRISGRRALKRISVSSVNSVRVPKPPPVASRQKASDSQIGSPERLSTLSAQTLLAAIARSLSQEGRVLRGTVDGSMRSAFTTVRSVRLRSRLI